MNMFARFDEIPAIKILRKQNDTNGQIKADTDMKQYTLTQFAGGIIMALK